MTVYRIVLEKWAGTLKASGCAARWNSAGKLVIYSAASRSLACLENLVHRNGEILYSNFKTIEIDIPGNIKVETVSPRKLIKQWKNVADPEYTQSIGDQWIASGKSAVLKVPSILVPEEHNYIINVRHKDFLSIRIKKTTSFLFDERFIKANS